MTYDMTDYDDLIDCDEIKSPADDSVPPLCLVHYFAERAAYPPERISKPPGRQVGRVAERHGNLIVLEFTAPPNAVRTKREKGRQAARVYDVLVILLLIACLLGCLAAFRF